jgi:O-antigen ligase
LAFRIAETNAQGRSLPGRGSPLPLPQFPDHSNSVPLAFGLALVFLRFSMLHQVQTLLVGVNFHLLYIVGVPALAAVLLSGGIRRSFRGRPTFCWVGFAVWLLLAVPFSYYRRGSAELVITYIRTDFLLLFVLGGLVVTWAECRKVMYVIAWAAFVNVLTGRLLSNDYNAQGRLGLTFGTISNPNDFAAHLILVLPFLLWITLSSGSFMVRAGALLGVLYGLYLVLHTGSRGALVGIAVALAFVFLRATARQRLALLVLGPVAGLMLLAFTSQVLTKRLSSFTTGEDESAIESTRMRQYLFRQSIRYTFSHPIFGVGPGEFPEYEGTHEVIGGTTHGDWQQTHNSYTQVSSECGIPAFLFYVSGLVSSFRLLSATHRQAKQRRDCRDIQTMVFSIQLGMVGYCAAICFVNFAYFFYLPAIGGLAVSVWHAAQHEFSARTSLVDPKNVPDAYQPHLRRNYGERP